MDNTSGTVDLFASIKTSRSKSRGKRMSGKRNGNQEKKLRYPLNFTHQLSDSKPE